MLRCNNPDGTSPRTRGHERAYFCAPLAGAPAADWRKGAATRIFVVAGKQEKRFAVLTRHGRIFTRQKLNDIVALPRLLLVAVLRGVSPA
ncbi:hypothetical protein KCP76_17035 [Salmonella enterica subsp. enterica serovar Weltevreden]|nr:hypothetical protein KCP76_17035 [Salmonella enterica subsp. enterica serovar Weltevreden]